MYLLVKNNIVVATASLPVSNEYLSESGTTQVEGNGTIGDAVFQGTVVVKPSPRHILDVANKTWLPPTDWLATAKKSANNEIDIKAGQARSKYITSVPGQSETYTAKYEDAKAFVAAGYPLNTTDYPWVKADSEAYGITPEQSANNIIALRNAWTNIGATVEKIRLGGKTQVNAATTVAEINTIVSQTVATLELV